MKLIEGWKKIGNEKKMRMKVIENEKVRNGGERKSEKSDEMLEKKKVIKRDRKIEIRFEKGIKNLRILIDERIMVGEKRNEIEKIIKRKEGGGKMSIDELMRKKFWKIGKEMMMIEIGEVKINDEEGRIGWRIEDLKKLMIERK